MARLPRYVIPGQTQNITQRSAKGLAVFKSSADFETFRDLLAETAGRHGLAVHAFVLMRNHVHLVATPTEATSLSKTLQVLGLLYVQYFHGKYQRTGPLWESRYRATVVDSDAYMLSIMRYIESNPLRVGATTNARDYPWSSHGLYAYGDAGPNENWLTPADEYMALGATDTARRQAYRKFFNKSQDAALTEEIRNATHKGWALGDARFQALIETYCDRRATANPRGRPRKS